MKFVAFLLTSGALGRHVLAAPHLHERAASSSSSSSSSDATATSVSTSLPSPSAAPGTPVVEEALPPLQPHCPSKIFCPGKILQTVQLAQLYSDQKTFVDKPARYPTDQIVASFNNLTSSANFSVGALEQWVDDHFLGEGLDLVPAEIPDYKDEPTFLNNVKDPYVKGFAKAVNSYWKDLARQNVKNLTCEGCESTLIPLNHTFVVPGGRFRENYYWDTYWILHGLLASEINSLAKSTLENFMDLLDRFGFIPNGAREYYLNRSQPPLFTHMVYLYIGETNDTSILSRALPSIEKEMAWWQRNRTTTIKSPYTKQKYQVTVYNVSNTAPRPEGYSEDYETAWGDTIGQNTTGFDLSKRDFIYRNLATGAESGEDFSAARWAKQPLLNHSSNLPSLRTLNGVNQIPVDLNSIMTRNFEMTSAMYLVQGATYNKSRSAYWAAQASARKAAVLDLHWDKNRLAFYDFNVTANARAKYWTVPSMWPYWSGIFPKEVLASRYTAQRAFAPIAYLTARYNGTLPHSLLDTGFQWDAPSSWPSLTWVAQQAVLAIPDSLAKESMASYVQRTSNFSYLPDGIFGLAESDLPAQTFTDTSTANLTTARPFGESGNVGDTSKYDKTNWRDGLAIALANRYTAAAFCSWYATGGSIPGLLTQLDDETLNKTNSVGNTGNMFEKFSALAIDAAGGGGEYTVQTGFGWTNGVLEATVQAYGPRLLTPSCPDLRPLNATSS